MLKKIGAGRRRILRGRSRKFAIGLGFALALGIVGIAYAEIYGDPFGLVAVGTTASDNPTAQYVAVANGGTATSTNCLPFVCVSVAASTTGNAYGASPISVTGCATGGIAISGTGCANAGGIAISGTGCANGDSLAISGTTCDAHGGSWGGAISPMGNAYGEWPLAISGTGNAYGSNAISLMGNAGDDSYPYRASSLALSGLGDASSYRVAVSGTGNSMAGGAAGSPYDPVIAVSGTGTASAQESYYFPGPFIAISGTNDASARDISVSGTGCASGGGIEIDPACGL